MNNNLSDTEEITISKTNAETEIETEKQVILHCTVKLDRFTHIRIWPTTYLQCSETGYQSKLLHAINIPFTPNMKRISSGLSNFTLIFGGLPNNCKQFDFIEESLSDKYPFYAKAIIRNQMDVYYLEVQY